MLVPQLKYEKSNYMLSSCGKASVPGRGVLHHEDRYFESSS
jgi:hypothetical protein